MGLILGNTFKNHKEKYKIASLLQVLGLLLFFIPGQLTLFFAGLFLFSGTGMLLFYIFYNYLLSIRTGKKIIFKVLLLLVSVFLIQYFLYSFYLLYFKKAHIYILLSLILLIYLLYLNIQKLSLPNFKYEVIQSTETDNKFPLIYFLYLFFAWGIYLHIFSDIKINHLRLSYGFDTSLLISLLLGGIFLYISYKFQSITGRLLFYFSFLSVLLSIFIYLALILDFFPSPKLLFIILMFFKSIIFFSLFIQFFYLLTKLSTSKQYSIGLIIVLIVFIYRKVLPSIVLAGLFKNFLIFYLFIIGLVILFFINRNKLNMPR